MTLLKAIIKTYTIDITVRKADNGSAPDLLLPRLAPRSTGQRHARACRHPWLTPAGSITASRCQIALGVAGQNDRAVEQSSALMPSGNYRFQRGSAALPAPARSNDEGYRQ